MTPRILIISDDEPNGSLHRALVAKGFDVTIAADAEAGYRQIVEAEFDLLVVNLARPISGANLIKRIRATGALNRLKILTIAEWGTGLATIALSEGADGYEPGPLDSDRVVAAIEEMLGPGIAMTASAGDWEN